MRHSTLLSVALQEGTGTINAQIEECSDYEFLPGDRDRAKWTNNRCGARWRGCGRSVAVVPVNELAPHWVVFAGAHDQAIYLKRKRGLENSQALAEV
jgi:hypothetical protein